MAQRIITTTEFTDDLDGGKAEGTVSFSYDGTHYEIDLSKKNRTALEKALKPYIEAGRKARPTRSARRGRSAGSSRKAVGSGRSDLSDVRAWARENGSPVSDRGRIPQSVLDAYDAAH